MGEAFRDGSTCTLKRGISVTRFGKFRHFGMMLKSVCLFERVLCVLGKINLTLVNFVWNLTTFNCCKCANIKQVL